MNVPLSVVIGSLAVVGSVPLLIWALSTAPRRTSDLIHQNLSGSRVVVDERRITLESSAGQRFFVPAMRSLAARARRLTPAGWIDALEHRLRLAGSPRKWPLERVLAAKIILGVAGNLLAIYILTSGIEFESIVYGLTASFGGYFVPDLILLGRARERQRAIQLALPDRLDQLTVIVEAGLGFDAALQRSASAGEGPLVEEFNRTLGELKIGVDRRTAFDHMLDRTDVPELRHFVFALRQASQYGISITNVLRLQSAELRIKRRQRAEEKALKLPVKMVLPLVTCIFPNLFIVLLGPAMIRLTRALI